MLLGTVKINTCSRRMPQQMFRRNCQLIKDFTFLRRRGTAPSSTDTTSSAQQTFFEDCFHFDIYACQKCCKKQTIIAEVIFKNKDLTDTEL